METDGAPSVPAADQTHSWRPEACGHGRQGMRGRPDACAHGRHGPVESLAGRTVQPSSGPEPIVPFARLLPGAHRQSYCVPKKDGVVVELVAALIWTGGLDVSHVDAPPGALQASAAYLDREVLRAFGNEAVNSDELCSD
jgi:hypothetical protein